MCYLTLTIAQYRGSILDKWVQENPSLAEQLLQGIRHASFGFPDAGQLVLEIEGTLTRGSRVAEVASRMVEGAAEELGDGVRAIKIE